MKPHIQLAKIHADQLREKYGPDLGLKIFEVVHQTHLAWLEVMSAQGYRMGQEALVDISRIVSESTNIMLMTPRQ